SWVDSACGRRGLRTAPAERQDAPPARTRSGPSYVPSRRSVKWPRWRRRSETLLTGRGGLAGSPATSAQEKKRNWLAPHFAVRQGGGLGGRPPAAPTRQQPCGPDFRVPVRRFLG